MSMQIAKMMSKGRMTVPEAARLAEGDLVIVKVEVERLVVRKLVGGRGPFLVGLEVSLDEWNSPDDEAAWRELWASSCRSPSSRFRCKQFTLHPALVLGQRGLRLNRRQRKVPEEREEASLLASLCLLPRSASRSWLFWSCQRRLGG